MNQDILNKKLLKRKRLFIMKNDNCVNIIQTSFGELQHL